MVQAVFVQPLAQCSFSHVEVQLVRLLWLPTSHTYFFYIALHYLFSTYIKHVHVIVQLIRLFWLPAHHTQTSSVIVHYLHFHSVLTCSMCMSKCSWWGSSDSLHILLWWFYIIYIFTQFLHVTCACQSAADEAPLAPYTPQQKVWTKTLLRYFCSYYNTCPILTRNRCMSECRWRSWTVSHLQCAHHSAHVASARQGP